MSSRRSRTLMKFMPKGMNAEFLISATFSFGGSCRLRRTSVLVQFAFRFTQHVWAHEMRSGREGGHAPLPRQPSPSITPEFA